MIAPSRQSSECTPCGDNVVSRDETRTLCQCNIGYYMDDYSSNLTNCIKCPAGADCSSVGTRLSLIGTEQGYWRNSLDSINFEECPFPHRCEGGYYSQCKHPHSGYTCSDCNNTQYIRLGNSCWKCPESRAEIGVYIMLTCVITLIVFALILFGVNATAKKQLNIAKIRDTIKTIQDFKEFDQEIRSFRKITIAGATPYPVTTMVKLKLMILDLQVIAKLTTIWSREWSPAFSRFGQWFDILNMDIINSTAIECAHHISYYTRILFAILLPIITFILILIFYVIPQLYCRDSIQHGKGSEKWASRQTTKRKTIRLIIFLLYLLYIPITSTIFMIYKCVEQDDGYYLYFDLNEKCYTKQWVSWNYVCGVFG
eukprot:168260_1